MPARSPEEIHALLAATFNERDLDAYARNYEENAAMILPPEGNRASGRDAIRAAVEATFELRPEPSNRRRRNAPSRRAWLSPTPAGA